MKVINKRCAIWPGVFLAGLTAASASAQVTATPETPGQTLQGGPLGLGPRFLSRWDNPVMQGPTVFRFDQFSKRIDNQNWEYFKFDLWATSEGTVNNPNLPLTDVLETWPRALGVQTGAGQSFLWEAHGTRLAPRLTGAPDEGVKTVRARRNDWDLPVLADGAAGNVQLDPAVALVPVHVVELFVPGSAAFDSGWFPKEQADILLDDIWVANKLTVNSPNESPHDVIGTWQWDSQCSQPGCMLPHVKSFWGDQNTVLPDRIFDRCNVQFREVSYDRCAVSEEVFFNTDPVSGCNADAGLNAMRAAVEQCFAHITRPDKPGLSDGAITLIVAGTLTNPHTCVNPKIEAVQGNVVVAIPTGLNRDTALAHEFGHALGLDHVSNCPSGPAGDLMCPINVSMQVPGGSALTAGQCNVAHRFARTDQNAFVWK